VACDALGGGFLSSLLKLPLVGLCFCTLSLVGCWSFLFYLFWMGVCSLIEFGRVSSLIANASPNWFVHLYIANVLITTSDSRHFHLIHHLMMYLIWYGGHACIVMIPFEQAYLESYLPFWSLKKNSNSGYSISISLYYIFCECIGSLGICSAINVPKQNNFREICLIWNFLAILYE
jgi:hypothetical protein